jgi:hypothetical protein
MVNEGLFDNGNSGAYPERADFRTALQPYLNPGLLGEVGTQQRLAANKGTARMRGLQEAYSEASAYYKYFGEEQEPGTGVVDDEISAVLSDIPTSSTNYSRPRTVAAGYDPQREIMTVVFRDGMFYNYYDVSYNEWVAFSGSYSKGRPWLNKRGKSQTADGLFVSKPRGPANVADIDPRIREQLYRVSRAQQIIKQPKAHRYHKNEAIFDPTRGAKVGNYKRKGYGIPPKR